jgi:hypothetical protein
MQHLRPFGQTQQAGSSSSSSSSIAPGETEQLLGVQWPLLWGMHSSKAARNSSSTCGCSCRSLTCYVCTPPPRVTLQQLQLVLEVVCLTCTECSQEALRSPLLLALLLQRASPGVRAEFLNSADGTRLLVALQQALHQPAVAPTQQTTWSFCAEAGALSSRLPVTDQSLARQLAPSVIRAIFTLAWCFLDPDPGAGVAAAAAAGGTKDGSRRSATLVTAAAVARGSVLLCEGKSHWEGDWVADWVCYLCCVAPGEIAAATCMLHYGIGRSCVAVAALHGCCFVSQQYRTLQTHTVLVTSCIQTAPSPA